MTRWLRWIVGTAAIGTIALVTAVAGPASAHTAPYCGITWGSLDKSAGVASSGSLMNVRSGQHGCYDRLVLDVSGSAAGYTVRYVPAVHAQGSGQVVPLRGGAFLEIVARAPAYDVNTGHPTYTPADLRELVDLAGYRTFRQAAWGGSFEGYTTVGLGVRARLPFRVFTLAGPGSGSRLVIDVAHQW